MEEAAADRVVFRSAPFVENVPNKTRLPHG
jgi:hypothetical protein